MECCVDVFTETVLQIVKFYTVVKNNFKTDVSDCSPCDSPAFTTTKDYSPKRQF